MRFLDFNWSKEVVDFTKICVLYSERDGEAIDFTKMCFFLDFHL